MWDPKYSVGIKSIDKQHQRFFEIINSMYFVAGASQQRIDGDKLFKVISELVEYADTHLKFEEKCFIDFEYDGANEHVITHDLFRVKMKEYVNSIEKTDISLPELATEIAEFCKNWLANHILEMDHKYISTFLNHGM